MPRQPRSTSSTLNEHLRTITNVNKSVNELKFQKIIDCINERNEDKEQGLSGVKLYVWRTFPRIDNAKTGRKTTNVLTIDCVSVNEGNTTVTPLPSNLREFLTQQLGGGRYRISLNDKTQEASDGKGQPDQLAQTAIKIDHIEHSPILDPREIDESDPETAQWVTRQIALNALTRNANAVLQMPGDRTNAAPSAAATAAAGDSTGLAAVAMEAIRQRNDGSSDAAHKASITMVADTAKSMIEQARGATSPELLISLAQVLKGDSGGGMALMVPLLTTMISEQSKVQMQMFTLMMERRNTPPASVEDTNSGMAVVEKLLDLAERTAKPAGGGWMDTIKEMLPVLLPLFLARGLGGGGGGNGNAPDLAALAGMMNRGGAPGGGAAGMDTGAGFIPVAQVTPQLIQNLATRAWDCMSRQLDGTDLANGVEVFFSSAHYDAIHALGKDQLMAQLMATNMAANFQGAGPAFEKFIQEFLSYGNDEAAPDGGVPPGGAHAANSAPAGAV
jgi:hypothetical protein